MSIFNKVALQELKKNRTRTIVTIIGVILSAAMIMAVATFGVSLLNYMTKGAAVKYGDWHAMFYDVDSAFVQERISDKEVEDAAYIENIGYAVLEGGQNPDKPYLFISGFSNEALDSLPIHLVSGRLPENSGEILVPVHVAANGGVDISIGDTLTLAVGIRQAGDETLCQHDPYRTGEETLRPIGEKTYTVVGICQRASFEETSAPGYTLITNADTQNEADSLNLFVTLKNAWQTRSYAENAAQGHEYILNDEVLRFMGLSGDKLFNILLYTVIGIVVAIIMIGSIFLIYNSFSISLNERTRQIGILASVGATAKQLRNSVLFEGLCIGMVGIPIGILVGIGCMALVLSAVAGSFGEILYSGAPLTLVVSVPVIIAAAAISMVTILISSYIPAKKAANMPVMECIRQTNEVKVESRAVKTSKLQRRLFGLEGILALKNFKRNRKRYRSIVLSLVLSVVLFIATSSFVETLKQASEQAIVFTTYDIGLSTLDMDDSQMLAVYDSVKGVDGVYQSSYQVCVYYSGIARAEELSESYWEAVGGDSSEKEVPLTMSVQFVDNSTYLDIIEDLGLSVSEYTGENAKVIATAVMEIDDNRMHEVSEFPDLFKKSSAKLAITPRTSDTAETVNADMDGEDQTIAGMGQNVDITFVKYVMPDVPPMTSGAYEEQPYTFQILAPWSLKETLLPDESSVEIYAKGMTFQSRTPAQSTEEMKSIVEGMGVISTYLLMNMQETLSESRNYIFIANVFAYTFIIMISLIAVANVFNTISTNIKLRRRELAMLRSVGMSDRDFNKMMRFECVFYGVRALIFGLPIAVAASWLIYKGMYAGGAEGVHFMIPWTSMVISVISVLFVIFITMMYAVSKIKKENIIDALRDDMT